MGILFILLLCVVIFIALLGNTSNIPNNTHKSANKNSPGMYFMNLHEKIEQTRKTSIEMMENHYYIHLSDWYLTLAYSCQGRIDEINDMYDLHKEEHCILNNMYIKLLESEKKQIYAMARIAKRIEDAPIGNDMKDGETIGDYTDRKLLKSKAFMEKYQYYISFNFEKYYNEYISF